jgi:putative ABC transport system permease protein
LGRHRLTVLILVTEVAFSCAVICNVALMIGHRHQAASQPSGLSEQGLVMFTSTATSPVPHPWARRLGDIRTLREVPGVERVAAVESLPLNETTLSMTVAREAAVGVGVPGLAASIFTGSPGMLDTLGLKIVAGRDFSADEFVLDEDAGKGWQKTFSAILSRQLATRLFGSEPALGKSLYIEDHPVKVVGIVDHLLSPKPVLTDQNESTLIIPLLPDKDTVTYAIRVSDRLQPQPVLDAAVKAIEHDDPTRVIEDVRSFGDLRDSYFEHDTTMLRLLLISAVALLVVTTIGIAGLASFWVARRYKSVGIRRALGASRLEIARHFLLENFLVVVAGLILGFLLAYVLNGFLIVYYAEARLPPVYLGFGALVLMIAGQVAALGPAIRASHIPPSAAMRTS